MRRMALFMTMMAGGMTGQPPSGSLAGVVTTPDGKGVKQARVSLRLIPGSGAPLRNYVAQAEGDGQGRFEFGRLPVGRYRVCAQQPAEDVLNPCEWKREAAEVTIERGMEMKGYGIVLEKGYRWRVAVEDGAGLLAANERGARGPVEVVVTGGPHGARTARLEKRVGNRREYVMVVPYGRPMEGWVRGRYEFEDEKGKKGEAAGQRIQLRLRPEDAGRTDVVKITGVK